MFFAGRRFRNAECPFTIYKNDFDENIAKILCCWHILTIFAQVKLKLKLKIKKMNISVILIGIFVVLCFAVISKYNGLVRKRNMVTNAFAGIDVQLKKRYDMIPMLVETAKGYMQHEKEVLTRLAQLRSTPYANMSNDEKSELDKGIVKIVEGLRVTVEKYPELKASENMLQLQRSINETEEQLSASRRSYNAAVMSYNNSLQTFPSNIIASMFGFQQSQFFAANAEERESRVITF